MRTLTVTLPPLDRRLKIHSNGNSHWGKSAATKTAREEARTAAERESLKISSIQFNKNYPAFKSAKAHIVIHSETKLDRLKKAYIPRDLQNIIGATKAYFDGLVDAGWLADDSIQYLTGISGQVVKKSGKSEVQITFTEVSE